MVGETRRALADTSVFVGIEASRIDEDSWIAATAIRHGIPVVTQDSDDDETPELQVLRL